MIDSSRPCKSGVCWLLGGYGSGCLVTVFSPYILLTHAFFLHICTVFAGGLLDSKVHGTGAYLNVLALADLPETFCKDVSAGSAPLLGVDQIPQREFHPIVSDLQKDHRLNFKALHHEDALHFLNLRLRIVHELARVFPAYGLQHFRRALDVTVVGERQLNFIPDIGKIASVIENRSAKTPVRWRTG